MLRLVKEAPIFFLMPSDDTQRPFGAYEEMKTDCLLMSELLNCTDPAVLFRPRCDS